MQEGVYKDDMLNGYGRIFYKDGNYYEGKFQNGVKHG